MIQQPLTQINFKTATKNTEELQLFTHNKRKKNQNSSKSKLLSEFVDYFEREITKCESACVPDFSVSSFILSRNSPRRSMPAEKELKDSNWLTIRERSPKMWLKAP